MTSARTSPYTRAHGQEVSGGGLAVAIALAAPFALGQAKKAGPAGPKAKIDVKAVSSTLASGNVAEIDAALTNIRMAGKEGGKGATAPLAARLKNGLPKELLKKALETIGELEDPAAAESCEAYLAHRDPEVRLAAVRCLGGAKGPAATKALRVALADLDVRVHGLAATLLGEAKAAEAVPELVVALDKGVNEAAVSIGQLCEGKAGSDKSCDALTERLKSKPLDVIASGLQQVLTRKDVPDDYKKNIIKVVRELSSAKAREVLESVKKGYPKDGSKAVLDALDKAIKDLEGAK
ncbi:MAG: HEAT repeat domain-containing protein [Myxococcales bacterium]|nr:HEAT repeat domain-containing protein [Myxococcales bacterium]